MKKIKRGRIPEILFAIILLVFTGLNAFSFAKKGWYALSEGWNILNKPFGATLFEFNLTAMIFLVLTCVVAIIAFVTAITVFANTKTKDVFLKILFVSICVERVAYCVLFMFKMNTYWGNPLVKGNIAVWILMIFVTMLEFMVAVLLLLLACDKKIFAPVTLVFAVILAVIMCMEIVNTYVYTFFEIPLLPEVLIWQNAEILNEGIANMACYWSLCFALMGIFLSISTIRSYIEPRVSVPAVEEVDANTVKENNYTPTETSVQEQVTPEVLPEIGTDEDIKVNINSEEETATESLVVVEEAEGETSVDEDSVSQPHRISAKDAATKLIELTMRLQKGEISDEEYNRLKKYLFDKL